MIKLDNSLYQKIPKILVMMKGIRVVPKAQNGSKRQIYGTKNGNQAGFGIGLFSWDRYCDEKTPLISPNFFSWDLTLLETKKVSYFFVFKALYWKHIISRQECMASWGTPISATFIAKFAENFGPIIVVEPDVPSWRTIRALIHR